MRIVLHREIPEDHDLRCQWNELVQRMERPEVFYSYEWALAVQRAYRNCVNPLLLLAYEGNLLVGIAALAGDNRQTSFLAAATADYCDFIIHPKRRLEFVSAVFIELRRLQTPMLVLANLPADSATSSALRIGASNHGYSIFLRPAYRCAQITLRSREQRESMKQSLAGRKGLRYALKGLSKHGLLILEHLESADEVRKILPEFIAAHIARFSAQGRISNLAQPERQTFLSELAKVLSDPGWIVLTRLRAGDHVIAWNYGFRFAGSWFYYQPTFDSNFQKFSPGLCLLSQIVEEACGDPAIELVDLGLGEEGYKERFTTGSRQTLHATITTSTARRLRETVRYHAATAIKSSPRLEHWVRHLVGRTSPGGLQG